MKTGKFVGICILIFIVALLIGIITKFVIKPSWAKKYSVRWSDEIGTLYEDIPYKGGESNKFDLYVPKDSSKKTRSEDFTYYCFNRRRWELPVKLRANADNFLRMVFYILSFYLINVKILQNYMIIGVLLTFAINGN